MGEPIYKSVSINPNTEPRKPLRFVKPKELAANNTLGVILEGTYVGPVVSALDPGKSDFKFETDNEIIIVNSSGMLAKKMANVTVGDIVRLTYNGQAEIKSGKMAGRLAHSFDVDIRAS